MNFEHNIWRTFDRACRKIAQMVMATDLPREDPNVTERTRSEFCSNVAECHTSSSGGESLNHRPSPSINNACRTKAAIPSENCSMEEKDKHDLPTTNGPLGRSAELEVAQDGCNPNTQVLQLRQLLLLHLELIQQQQEQLQHKDKELNQLKIDKEQLEARIHRMERRMAMKKRHGTDDEDEIYCRELPGGKDKATKVPKRRPSTEQMIRSKRVPIQAPVVMTSTMCDDRISCDTHLRTETLYLSHNASISSFALDPQIPAPPTDESKDKKELSPIAVPSWNLETEEVPKSPSNKLHPSTTSSTSKTTVDSSSIPEEVEDLDDDAFCKRHAKLELDEKRRKRWDIQRIRSLTYHETLEKKHLEREQARLKGRKSGKEQKEDQKEFMLSFQPKPEGIMALEVSDTVPVVAFGAPIPLFHSKEFDLPWFSLEKRVLQERGKANRGNSRGKVRSRRRSNYR